MYILKRRNTESMCPPVSVRERALNIVNEGIQRLKDSSVGLEFAADTHEYKLNGTRLECVSDIVKSFAPFDVLAVAEACSKNPRHSMYGKTIEDIIAVWDAKRDNAAAVGTKVHAFGEACYLFAIGKEDEIDEEFKLRIDNNGLHAESPKEIAMAKWWQTLDLTRYIVVAKETMIANVSLKYAGTFDLLLYDTETNSFIMVDYKTNEDLYKWYGEMLRPPLNMLKANDIGKYTLQQNLYRLQLENLDINVGEMNLVWLKQDTEFEVVKLEEYGKLISYAVRNR